MMCKVNSTICTQYRRAFHTLTMATYIDQLKEYVLRRSLFECISH